MIFLTNEGCEDINTTASIDGETSLVAVDLWRGKYWKTDSTIISGKTHFNLNLIARESLLLILDEKDNFDPFSRRPENTAAMQANDIYKQWRYHFNKSQELLKLYNKIARKYNLKKIGVGQWAPGEESVRGSVPEFGFNSVRQKYTNDRPIGGYTNVK